MSDTNRNNILYPIFKKKTFFQKNSQNFPYQKTISPRAYKEISLKIEKNLSSQINQIKLDFNNCINKTLLGLEHRDIEQKHKKRITYNEHKKKWNQRSYDNLPNKIKEIKEKEKKDKCEVIKHNYSLKVLKPNFNRKLNFYRVKSIDINLKTENITPNNFSLIIKNKRKTMKKTSNSVKIKKRKTEFINKSKAMKNKFKPLNSDNLDIYNDKIKSKTKRNTHYNNMEKNDLLSGGGSNPKKEELNTASKKVKYLNIDNKNNKYKLNKKLERRKLSFDTMNNIIEKNINKETLGTFHIKPYKSNEQTKLIKPIKESSKHNKPKEVKNNEENCNYNLLTETEQGINDGINQIKINNYIINKPKEENMKFSSIKFGDNEEKTEKASEISKIIIGQIEGYKDIMDLDKSKSLMELLSKVSFSYAKNNNKQSIENVENINSNFLDDIICNNKEINNINITNIKNVDEDYDSEDLSNIIRNNIKSINTRSKEYIKRREINMNCRSNVKTSMNTNNTTISSRDKNNNQNTKKNEKEIKKVENTRINTNILKDYLPSKIKTKSDINNNLCDKKEKTKKQNYNNNNKNTLKVINKNEIKRNLAITKNLKTIKSTSNINKKIDTNSIFNSPHKNKKRIKQKITDDINYPINKYPAKNINQNEIINNKENDLNKKVNDNSLTTIINGDNETIINPFFNDAENEICKNNNQYNDKNKNVFEQCILF